MYYAKPAIMATPDACSFDITPPTFAGIATATVQANGSIRLQYPSATDATLPIKYNAYIARGTVTAASLFQASNRLAAFDGLLADLFETTDNVFLQAGYYTVGVRAIDGVGNESQNTQLLTVYTDGILAESVTQLIQLVRASLIGVNTIVSDVQISPTIDATVDSNKTGSDVDVNPEVC